MTLVVAKLDGNDAYVVSDTKLSYLNGETLPYHEGMLKTVIINLECCISFAGLTSYANEAIAHLIGTNYESVGELLEYLTEIHLKSNCGTDFGVITNIGENPKLYSIKDGKAGKELSHFWLGDRYDLFQKHYSNTDEKDKIRSRMKLAFDNVAQDGDAASIGGFVISTSTDHNSYQYEDSNGKRKISGFSYEIESINGRDGPIVIEGSGKGVAPIKGFSSDQLSVFSSISPYYPGVAIHYGHAKKGFLFCPHLQNEIDKGGDILKILMFEDVEQEPFLQKLKESYDISFKGFISKNESILKYVNT